MSFCPSFSDGSIWKMAAPRKQALTFMRCSQKRSQKGLKNAVDNRHSGAIIFHVMKKFDRDYVFDVLCGMPGGNQQPLN